MSKTPPAQPYAAVLAALVRAAGHPSLAHFCRAAGIGRRTLRHLQNGALAEIRLGGLQQVAAALGISLPELLERFGTGEPATNWQAEYERLVQQLATQETSLREAWDRAFFRQVEMLLLQLPTVRQAASTRTDLGAETVLDLLLPFEEFVRASGFVPLGTPGEVVAFDPQHHQGNGLTPGQSARIRTVGYTYKEQLLVRARVVPV